MESSFGLPFRPVLALAVPCPGFVPGALALSDPDRSGLVVLSILCLSCVYERCGYPLVQSRFVCPMLGLPDWASLLGDGPTLTGPTRP